MLMAGGEWSTIGVPLTRVLGPLVLERVGDRLDLGAHLLLRLIVQVRYQLQPCPQLQILVRDPLLVLLQPPDRRLLLVKLGQHIGTLLVHLMNLSTTISPPS